VFRAGKKCLKAPAESRPRALFLAFWQRFR